MAEDGACAAYFDGTKVPTNCLAAVEKIKDFVSRHVKEGRKLVLVTSGGTAVPLESRTVRFIDNFSIGSRGSISAEYFLESGYGVVFLHRRGSLEPFRRHLQLSNLLDMLNLQNGEVRVKDENSQLLFQLLTKHSAAKCSGTLLLVDFMTLSEYLFLLKASAEALSQCGTMAALYLAAAVSDFYIPSSNMPDHKIQSSDGPLQLSLQLVPKMLHPLVCDWCPQAFVVSFKLETNPDILLSKAKQALMTYHHQVVIGNILETRKKEVVVVTLSDEKWIRPTEAQVNHTGQEIERIIVDEIVLRHQTHINKTLQTQ